MDVVFIQDMQINQTCLDRHNLVLNMNRKILKCVAKNFIVLVTLLTCIIVAISCMLSIIVHTIGELCVLIVLVGTLTIYLIYMSLKLCNYG